MFTCFRKPAPNARVTFSLPFTLSLKMTFLSLGCSAFILNTSYVHPHNRHQLTFIKYSIHKNSFDKAETLMEKNGIAVVHNQDNTFSKRAASLQHKAAKQKWVTL